VSDRTVVFVCAHGAARSRIAAAWFNADPPSGWHATTAAGEVPAEAVNTRVPTLMDGTAARDHLDESPPRPLSTVDNGDVVVAIDCTVPGTHRWDLNATDVGGAMRDELREHVTELVRRLDVGLSTYQRLA
jgi:protein-tyrosine-phosphatase